MSYPHRLRHSQPSDLPAMLAEAKIGPFVQGMAIQYMHFLPETCDLYAQGVITIIEGLQRLLNDRGAHLEVDGNFTPETMRALEYFAGPNWHSKSWAQLYGDVIAGQPYPGLYRKPGRADQLGHTAYHQADGFVEDALNPFAVIATLACAYHGYQRNGTTQGAIAWGVAGFAFPLPALAVALIIGFGRKKGTGLGSSSSGGGWRSS